MANKTVLINTGTSWTVPSDYGTLVSIEGIGAGGNGFGSSTLNLHAGGGGGGYATQPTAAGLVAGSTSLTIQCGAAGGTIGTSGSPGSADTYVKNGATLLMYAQGGGNASSGAGGTGGVATNCFPTTGAFSGGSGSGGTSNLGGGGGAAGKNGAGTTSNSISGGGGDNGTGGAGGSPGSPGSPGTEWSYQVLNTTVSSGSAGSGGGGGEFFGGGLYGGGGSFTNTNGTNPPGAAGCIFFTYTTISTPILPTLNIFNISIPYTTYLTKHYDRATFTGQQPFTQQQWSLTNVVVPEQSFVYSALKTLPSTNPFIQNQWTTTLLPLVYLTQHYERQTSTGLQPFSQNKWLPTQQVSTVPWYVPTITPYISFVIIPTPAGKQLWSATIPYSALQGFATYLEGLQSKTQIPFNQEQWYPSQLPTTTPWFPLDTTLFIPSAIFPSGSQSWGSTYQYVAIPGYGLTLEALQNLGFKPFSQQSWPTPPSILPIVEQSFTPGTNIQIFPFVSTGLIPEQITPFQHFHNFAGLFRSS